mmetsp:Transcript_40650/g.135449  ORF Transcript_40650/g.135449 Transcript_40650/m.135449 type:complete len:389 (+) Transcript_40650:39-1205(+)
MRRINEAAGRAGAAIRDLQPRRGDSPFAASRPSPTRRHSIGSQRHSGYSASKEGKESPASSRPSKPTLSYHGPFAAELLPAASAAARAAYEATLSMTNDELQQLAELVAAAHCDRSTYLSTEAWQFGTTAYAIPGNEVCADCGSSEPPTWAAMVGEADAVLVCNECCGGHRALGVHLSAPLSLKMDRWSDEKRQRLLSSGNRAVNATLEAHAAAAQCKPSSEADVSAKHVFVRSKYERRAFAAEGDGELLPSTPTGRRCAGGAPQQVHAGILVVRLIRAHDLIAADFTGKSDPYVKVTCGKAKSKTRVIRRTLSPEWNEVLRLNVEDVRDVLMLQVKDNDTIGSSPLGDCSLSLAELRPNHGTELSLELQNVRSGRLVVEVTWCPLDG